MNLENVDRALDVAFSLDTIAILIIIAIAVFIVLIVVKFIKWLIGLFSYRNTSNEAYELSEDLQGGSHKYDVEANLDYALTSEGLLTKREQSFFHMLLPIAQKYNLYVAIKPRLADFIEVTLNRYAGGIESSGWHSSFNKIAQKHIDFLLCDLKTLKPLLAIELDDKTHLQDKVVERDEFVNNLYDKIRLSIARFEGYTKDEIEHAVLDAMVEAAMVSCENCDAQMKLRDGIHGYFVGCSSYPNCKRTLTIDSLLGEYYH